MEERLARLEVAVHALSNLLRMTDKEEIEQQRRVLSAALAPLHEYLRSNGQVHEGQYGLEW